MHNLHMYMYDIFRSRRVMKILEERKRRVMSLYSEKKLLKFLKCLIFKLQLDFNNQAQAYSLMSKCLFTFINVGPTL